VLLLAAEVCFACDCNTLSPAESFKAADLVFVGSVVSSDQSAGYVTSTFRVDQVMKGSNTDEVVIANQMSDCDFVFQPGVAYIVYAGKAEGRFFASTCMRTKAISAPSTQQSFIRYTSPPRYDYRLIVAGVVILFALVVGYFAGRFRRPHSNG
jgi:hypothetical protein